MEIFGEAPRLRFELCKVRLTYKTIIKDHQLNGSIQAATSCYSPDPLLKNDFFDIFNREFNNPLPVSLLGTQYLDDIRRCSLLVSSTFPVIQIAAKLYITTDKARDVKTSADIDHDDDMDDCDVDDDDGDDVLTEATAAVYRNNFRDLDTLLLGDYDASEATS